MILGGSKRQVIENIRVNLAAGELNRKVELDDPDLSPAELQRHLDNFWRSRTKATFKLGHATAQAMVQAATKNIFPHITITGQANLSALSQPSAGGKLQRATPVKPVENFTKHSADHSPRHPINYSPRRTATYPGGLIITSNHFNPLDSLNVRKVTQQILHKRLYAVIQDANVAMSGDNGFLMNNLDNLPISKSPHYMINTFMPELKKVLDAGAAVLIYPEEEMWFNYRKPRPCKRGAYQFAHQLNTPVLPLFVEIREQAGPIPDNDEFYQVEYTVHILKPIFPNPALSARADSKRMATLDYQQKVAAYELAYGKKLTYDFDSTDIAGWR